MASSSPPSSMPELDLIATAKTTRKTLERLAPFSQMQSSSNPSPLLSKIVAKMANLIRLIDASIIASQLGYQLATDAMIMCDPDEGDWEADVSLSVLREVSKKGRDKTKEVADGFREIKQEVYKIAASTKNSKLVVVVKPEPTHSDNIKIQLKDVGIDLVANLNLLAEFSLRVNAVEEWWAWVNNDLSSETPSLLPPSLLKQTESPSERTPEDDSLQREKFAMWMSVKDQFQGYYNQINVAHNRFPDLLASSATAWRAVASARSVTPSSDRHVEERPFLSANAEPRRPLTALGGLFALRSRKQKVNKADKNADKNANKDAEKENQDPTATNSERKSSKSKEKAPETLGEAASRQNATPARTPSSRSSRSSHSRASQRSTTSKKSKHGLLASCLSGILFTDGVGYLGCHGFMTK
ncbi:hypothetical protein NLJ89_g1286 [Agrocybe chaxingu]|uniref:Uncharacterized protein n=1 Tax=Agrocybe chaxingu TaxID=84603 RepID=A0A9W8N0C7_9AGAR|nr:hypothetical protein NLJ89_g1286 [Agrocybe chaxingu]